MVSNAEVMELASAGNPVNWFLVVNGWSDGLLAVALLIAVMLILITIMRSNGTAMQIAVPVSLFVGTLLTGVGLVISYNGNQLFEVVHFSVLVFMLVISLIILSVKSGLQGE